MHYQHRYHAGNFADVFKHLVLCGLLAALNRKDGAWCYLETHAGAGAYDLCEEAAARTGEWRDGIGRLVEVRDPAGLLKIYLRTIGDLANLRHYPGSPLIAQAFAREQDRLVLCEKIPAIADELRANLRGETRAAIHQRDGYEAHGLLPPSQKRGLILIDPPFEARDEFGKVRELLEQCLARFAHGIYAIWYPVKNDHEARRFVRGASALGRSALNIRFDNGAAREGQMRECGMLLINPPYALEGELAPALAQLARVLAQGVQARYGIERLAQA